MNSANIFFVYTKFLKVVFYNKPKSNKVFFFREILKENKKQFFDLNYETFFWDNRFEVSFKKNMNLSIVIPVYNEKESLSLMIKILNSTLEFNNEIIIVYDNEDDKCEDQMIMWLEGIIEDF